MAVKPHASPVFHAIQYLLGNLDRSYLTRLRARGGLQSYPSRRKDPDEVDFATGSVGLGAAAPLFAAVTRRYVDAHFGERPHSRFISLIGDAELDEGNVWEAVADPATTGLGNVTWLVDFNRQSLDRVVPGVRIDQWRGQFQAAGWHVVEVKYGRRLQAAFAEPGGESLRAWIDEMPNEQYQSLFGQTPAALRKQFLDGAPSAVEDLVRHHSDEDLATLVTDLGGHDLLALLAALRECDQVAGPAQRALRLHDQGLGPADRRQPAQPLRTAHHDPGRRAAPRDRPGREHRVGAARPGHTGRDLGQRPARAAGPRTPIGRACRSRCRRARSCGSASRSRPRRRSAESWSSSRATRWSRRTS